MAATQGLFGEVSTTASVLSSQTPSTAAGYQEALMTSSSWVTFDFVTNSSVNATTGDDYVLSPFATTIMILIFCIIILGTILGNLLVLSSVCIEKKLQSPPNILIINLAVADLAIATLVMPFAASYNIKNEWLYSNRMCDMFISFDVTCCTASIVDLCFISVDRYLAITRPFRYARYRTTKLMVGVVAIVWAISGIISITPVFIFGNEYADNQCLLSQDPIYTIYSTFGAFYIPLLIMIVVYYKIYRAAGELEKKELQRRPSTPGLLPRGSLGARSGSVSSDSDSAPDHSKELRRKSSLVRFSDYVRSVSRNSLASAQFGKNRISLKLERKASKTLGVIMGAFVFCWLPFFILAITRVFCSSCTISPALNFTLLWLGYINSMLNPIIYPFFNKDFGPAYRKMLRLGCHKLCPDRAEYKSAKPAPPRKHSLGLGSHHHVVLATCELQAIAEDSHDESDHDKLHDHVLNSRDQIKYDPLHLDRLNGNSKKSDNLNEVTATAV